MSREIKFRAWNTIHNRMLQWGNLNNQHNTLNCLSYEHLKVMQYTGLKDKNDKEIYEGDIVKIIRFARYNSELKTVLKTSTCEVVFDKLQYLFHDTYKDDFIYKFADIEYSYNGVKDIEVIGNIYENKELLE